MSEPGPTIVIPVLNEVENIADLLDDCAAQSLVPAEVVVVDAGSRDGTFELLQERARRWPRLRVLSVPGATPGRGRNEAIARTSAPAVATLDAGSRVGSGWLAELAAALGDGSGRVCVGVAEADAHTPFERAAGWLTLTAFKPSDRAGPLGRPVTPAGRNGYCFSVEAWRLVGGYPPGLPWGEDKLFVERLRRLGFELMPVPAAAVRWRPRRNLRELYVQYERYARGDAMARSDLRNTLVTLALYGGGAAVTAAAKRRGGAALLAPPLLAGSYLGLFVLSARRELDDPRALAWLPAIRVAADLAKLHGFLRAATRPRTSVQARAPRPWSRLGGRHQ